MKIDDIKPFESEEEQRNYCKMCSVPFEEGSVGFKIADEMGNLGMCQLMIVSHDAYILGLGSCSGESDAQFLTDALKIIVSFFETLKIRQISFPIISSFQADIAEDAGFEALSDTLYVYVFDSFKEEDKLWGADDTSDI